MYAGAGRCRLVPFHSSASTPESRQGGTAMEPSSELKDLTLRSYAALSNGDLSFLLARPKRRVRWNWTHNIKLVLCLNHRVGNAAATARRSRVPRCTVSVSSWRAAHTNAV